MLLKTTKNQQSNFYESICLGPAHRTQTIRAATSSLVVVDEELTLLPKPAIDSVAIRSINARQFSRWCKYKTLKFKFIYARETADSEDPPRIVKANGLTY
jgi:hypothetical protein